MYSLAKIILTLRKKLISPQLLIVGMCLNFKGIGIQIGTTHPLINKIRFSLYLMNEKKKKKTEKNVY